MILYGDDFAFMNAFMSFRNIERLIKYCNKHQSTNMQFKLSTPGKYLDALNKEKNVVWPVVKDIDFFPYVESHLVAWSGFFTSRPGFKK